MINPNHDRSGMLVSAALAAATLGAWGLLLHVHQAMPRAGESPSGTLPALFLMWSLMMAAMMIPAAWPMVQTYDRIALRRRPRGRLFSTGLFAGAYLAVWFLFSLAAALLQWAIMPAVATQTQIPSAILAGSLFIGAGLYQFTQLKHACLHHCRTPLGFILNAWRDGPLGAVAMGLHHGLHCLGCCWAMMMVMLSVGVMDMTWMGVITLWVILEKRPTPWARNLSAAIGWLLIGWGAWTIVS